MKMTALLILSVFLMGCTDNDDTGKVHDAPTSYILTSASTNISGSEPLTGDDLPYNETIVLKDSISFSKTRNQDGTISKEDGSFSWEFREEGKYLVLVYPNESSIIHNCSDSLKEILSVANDSTLINMSNACDMLGLVYAKSE